MPRRTVTDKDNAYRDREPYLRLSGSAVSRKATNESGQTYCMRLHVETPDPAQGPQRAEISLQTRDLKEARARRDVVLRLLAKCGWLSNQNLNRATRVASLIDVDEAG